MALNPAGTGGMQLGRLTELRQRLLFLLGALIVYRIGTFIPVPGVNPAALAALFDQQQGTILDMFNMFSGGALSRASLFALGIMPYISASIIIQLMTAVIPKLEQLKKEGEAGRRKITQYTRYGTLGLATFQAIGISVALQGQFGEGLVVSSGPGFVFTATVSLVLPVSVALAILLGVEAVPAVVYFLSLFSVPESPRWLVMQGRDDAARDVVSIW